MRGSIIGIGIGMGLLIGCAPDLAANGAARCQESLECGPEAVCYRGFCVADEGLSSDAGSTPVDIADASQPSAAQAEHDAAITPSNEVADAGSAVADASSATPASQPSPTPAPQPGPSAPDPSAMPPKQSMPSQPTPQAGQDAGPIVVDLPGSCTLADCCAEARQSLADAAKDDDDDEPSGPGPGGGAKGDDDDEPKAKRVKACGCADPSLLSGVLCGLLGPLGV